MNHLNNPMEIFKLLEKSNCRACNEPTCLAFAAAVFQGRKQLGDCPKLAADVVAAHGVAADTAPGVEQDMDEAVAQLKRKVAGLDLSVAAERTGARFADGRLTIRILGKELSVDSQGNLSSDIHINPWVAIPVLSHILEGKGMPVSGKWVPFRELPGGKTWHRLFGQRCEKPIKRLADDYTDLFEEIIRIFSGRQVEKHYASDISLVLAPLPKVPILICYWKPEDGLESSLNLFFDSTAEENMAIESLYTLTTGLVTMFEKIAQRHSFQP